jgi:hypothetical protein
MTKLMYPGMYNIGTEFPVLVVDDDFIEHLHEEGFDHTIDINDLIFEWIDWAKENIDEQNAR